MLGQIGLKYKLVRTDHRILERAPNTLRNCSSDGAGESNITYFLNSSSSS